MSTNPSIIFHQGLRCTKVRRQPRATDSQRPSYEENVSATTTIDAPTAVGTSIGSTTLSDTSSDQSISNENITNAPATTTNASIPEAEVLEQTASQRLEPQPPGQGPGTHNTFTDHSLPHTTLTTDTTTAPQPTTSVSDSVPSASDNDSSGPPYGKIFGILFGILGFIALIALLIFFFLRRRKHQQADEPQEDRASADSRTGLRQDFHSQMTYLRDASPEPSINLPDVSQMQYSIQQHPTQMPRQHDPFSDMEEARHEPGSFVVPIIPQRPATAPGYQSQAQATEPVESDVENRDSIQSATSLGSTIVLPGRNSISSEYNGLNPSYPKSPADGSTYPMSFAPQTNTTPRSGSPDLVTSQSGNVVPRRSSDAMPGGFL